MSVVKPGHVAPVPFIDRRERLFNLPPHEQDAVMGRSLFRLWKRGVIRFDDAVTAAGVLTLAEVVFAHRLTVEALIAAGIAEHVARRAREDADRLADNPRDRDADLIAKLKDAMAAHEGLVRHLADATPRATATPPARLGGLLLPTAIGRDDDEKERRRRDADELRRLLARPGR